LIFCGLSGCVYLLNDFMDMERDKLHPDKCRRPLASGDLSIPHAGAEFIIILLCSATASIFYPRLFIGSAIAYFIVNLLYSFWLKNVVILDVLCISIGFVLRAQAGIGACRAVDELIYFSHWLLLSTLVLAMFLALAKRRQEIKRLKDDASSHRRILQEYSLHYLDEMTGIVGALTIITYTFYTVSAETIKKFGTDNLVYTVPLVIYGVFRYLYLIHIKNLGDNPSEVFLSDRPLQITLGIWIITMVLLIHASDVMGTSFPRPIEGGIH